MLQPLQHVSWVGRNLTQINFNKLEIQKCYCSPWRKVPREKWKTLLLVSSCCKQETVSGKFPLISSVQTVSGGNLSPRIHILIYHQVWKKPWKPFDKHTMYIHIIVNICKICTQYDIYIICSIQWPCPISCQQTPRHLWSLWAPSLPQSATGHWVSSGFFKRPTDSPFLLMEM